MSDTVKIIIDGEPVQAKAGQTILQAAAEAGIYIPHLCYHEDLTPGGHCRVCTVKVNGKPINSCTMVVGDGMVIENDTEELNEMRKSIIEMLLRISLSSSSRATTSAPRVRRAATASSRPWPIASR